MLTKCRHNPHVKKALSAVINILEQGGKYTTIELCQATGFSQSHIKKIMWNRMINGLQRARVKVNSKGNVPYVYWIDKGKQETAPENQYKSRINMVRDLLEQGQELDFATFTDGSNLYQYIKRLRAQGMVILEKKSETGRHRKIFYLNNTNKIE